MADSPAFILNDALARLISDAGLASYEPDSVITERGTRIDGVMPTSVDEFTLITPLAPLPDGRSDMTYRAQIFTRRRGSVLDVLGWAADLRRLLDQKAYVPRVLGISWAWEFNSTEFEPDTQGRSSVAATYMFRGRR